MDMYLEIFHLLIFFLIALLPAQPAFAGIVQKTFPLQAIEKEKKVDESTTEDITKSLASLIQPFIENQGQFNNQVAYAIRHGNGSIFLTNQGALVFSFNRSAQDASALISSEADNVPTMELTSAKTEQFSFRIIPDADATTVSYKGRSKANTVVNYFVGPRENWRGAIPTWKEVSYDGIFPGINVVYKAGSGMVEDIYELKPGAKPSSIRFRVEGAERLELQEDGSLQVITTVGPFTIKPPVAFQEIQGVRQQIACRFVTDGLSYGFSMGHYDSRLALVIDPQLVYASFLGGAGSGDGRNMGYSIAVADGKAYLAGNTDTTLFPVTTGSYAPSFEGSTDLFVSIVNPQGNGEDDLVYSTFLGGSSSECLGGCNNTNGRRGIALDTTGRIWLTGYTASTDFPTTTGAFQEAHSGGDSREGFFTIIDPQGNGTDDLVYSSYLGGVSYDEGFGIAVADSKAWIIGTTTSDDFPTTTGAYDTTNNTRGDVFLTILAPQGNGSTDLLYSTYLGGTLNESGYDIAVADNKAWLTGYVASSDFPVTAGAYDTGYSGNLDAFLSIISPQGNGTSDLVYSTYLGSSSYDQAFSIAVANGYAWLTGYTQSTAFPVTAGAFDTSYNGLEDVFLTIINPQGAYGADLVYSTFIGGSDNDLAFSLTVASNKAWLTGRTMSDNLPTSTGAYDTTYNDGAGDSFLTIIAPLGGGSADLVYSTYLGGSNQENGYGLAVADGKAWLTGHTGSSDFPVSTGSYDTTFSGGTTDTFLAIINPLGSGTDDLIYSSYFGAYGGSDYGYDIALAEGKAWLVGNSESIDFPISSGAADTTLNEIFFTIIDPKAGKNGLLYSTFLGGSNSERVNSIVVSDSKAWLTGYTSSSDFPVTSGAYDTSFNGSNDTFLTVINPKGNGSSDIFYSTFLGGDTNDAGNDLVVTDGKAWLTGYSDSATFPITALSVDTTHNGSTDAFFSIIQPGGNGTADLIYSTFLGGINSDRGMSIAVEAGKAWLTGETYSPDLPTTANGYDRSYHSSNDIFFSIINPLGQGANDLIYSTYIGGDSGDRVKAIEVDKNMAWLAGYTTSSDFPVTPGAYAETHSTYEDIFLTLINPGKTGASGLYYSTYLGGTDEDYLYDLAVSDGKAWLVGEVYSTDFPTTADALAPSYLGGGRDAFLSVITPQGKGNKDLLYSTYIGGKSEDSANGIAVLEGTAWLTGYTTSSDFPLTADAYDTKMTPPDAFLLLFEVYRKFPWPMFLPATTKNSQP